MGSARLDWSEVDHAMESISPESESIPDMISVDPINRLARGYLVANSQTDKAPK